MKVVYIELRQAEAFDMARRDYRIPELGSSWDALKFKYETDDTTGLEQMNASQYGTTMSGSSSS